MTVEWMEKLLMILLGGLASFAWSQVTQGHRLTRLETKVDLLPGSIDEKMKTLKHEVAAAAGRRASLMDNEK